MRVLGFGSSSNKRKWKDRGGDSSASSASVSPTAPISPPLRACMSMSALRQQPVYSHPPPPVPAIPHGLTTPPPPYSIMPTEEPYHPARGSLYPPAVHFGPSIPISSPRLHERPSTSGGRHTQRPARNDPWTSTTALSTTARPRDHALSSRSALNLPNAVASSLNAATRSVNNLNEAFQAQCQVPGNLYDRISARLNEVIDGIDDEIVGSHDDAIELYQPLPSQTAGPSSSTRTLRRTESGSTPTSNSFSKVWLYANSRLPPYLPPLKLYMPTYPLLCLAAQYSLRVYDKPYGKEREDHIKGSVLHRTKAMTLKSLPLDDMNTIVFAIRGSASFIDWAMNFRPAPSSPEGFLDDPGNLCHAGFLSVAKSMIEPVAKRLRTLLADNPHRSASSLLITGHSAGGAVAQLLYSHMLSRTVDSELAYLAGFFKRVHCVTFGTPPVSLLPLSTPSTPLKQNKKSLFFSFVNEGDPVARADKAIVRSLLKLYATPAPNTPCPIAAAIAPSSLKPWKRPRWRPRQEPAFTPRPTWPVPNATLSMGGRVILLRQHAQGKGPEDIEAVTVSDDLLRDVIFGDPECHTMTLYSKRIEILATRAVTVGGFRH